ncbi:MAG: bleomycin resistance protein [Nocardioides sp.]|nr:bleomycin resistance protein [Nocardioides sp.]
MWLSAIRYDAVDPRGTAAFWSGLLQWPAAERPDGTVALTPDDPRALPLVLCPTDIAKTTQNRIHLDVTSRSPDHMDRLVRAALDLGGAHVDVGQSPDEDHVVLADPDGNELCVIPPDNQFLAGTGVVGAVNCDGTATLGRFWSAVLDWPLVWDQDEETAIQSPGGGPKITWSGPPLMPRTGRDRWRLEVTAAGPTEIALAALVTRGATVPEQVEDAVGTTVLDPDGNEFHVLGT